VGCSQRMGKRTRRVISVLRLSKVCLGGDDGERKRDKNDASLFFF
jgi:hypothetical protein